MYNQPVKNKSRELIWKHAIESITINRENNKVLNHKNIRELWEYCFEKLELNPESRILNDWMEFSYSIYGQRKPSDLKIAYLCGPDPLNDLGILIKFGIKIENVWAIEKEEIIYKQAIENAKKSFPNLKIFKGSFDDFIKISDISFDIIYLDFTGPIFSKESKAFITINSVFEERSLSDLGILITNFSEPEKNEENINFLSSYFAKQEWIERGIYDESSQGSSFIECFGSYSITDFNEIKRKIENNFYTAYSAFCSHYPVIYSNIVAPAFRTVKNKSMRSKLYNNNDLFNKIPLIIKKIEEYEYNYEEEIDYKYEEEYVSLEKKSKKDIDIEALFEAILNPNSENDYENYLINEIDDIATSDLDPDYLKSLFYEDAESFPFWHFLKTSKEQGGKLSKYWDSYFGTKEEGVSRFYAIVLRDLIKNYDMEKTIINPILLDCIKEIDKIVRKHDIFCDVPIDFLWIELAINQMGAPYHSQFHNHKRYKYKAQRNDMYLDIFTFDKCRSLYEWIPLVEMLPDFVNKVEREILLRSMLHVIGNEQSIRIIPQLYWGSALIGIGSGHYLGQLMIEKLPIREEITQSN